jgi:hypothetical protein
VKEEGKAEAEVVFFRTVPAFYDCCTHLGAERASMPVHDMLALFTSLVQYGSRDGLIRNAMNAP